MAEMALTAAPQGAPPAPPAPPPPALTVAELDIDQSHLPRVNEVRQSFAVREDGVLAHNLQEQESEYLHLAGLVQRDIRVAKRLQGEEEVQRRQHRALLQHTSRQLYAGYLLDRHRHRSMPPASPPPPPTAHL
ncbi:hypothetical protein CRUP_032912 [Coryphaenoides rupestris]|nr:hypothetical protein CRUP_032912 [Coryphaenoides rupestris]